VTSPLTHFSFCSRPCKRPPWIVWSVGIFFSGRAGAPPEGSFS